MQSRLSITLVFANILFSISLSVAFPDKTAAQNTNPIKQSNYVCSDDPAKQVFGKQSCTQYVTETVWSLSESVAIYLYASMKRQPLAFDEGNFCKMKTPGNTQFVLTSPLCSSGDLSTNTNILGESCGKSSCQFGKHGMKVETCNIENTLDLGALIPIALAHLDKIVKKINQGQFALTKNDGEKETCGPHFKQLDNARKELDGLQKEFMEKYALPQEKIGSVNLKKVCFSKTTGAVSDWAAAANLNAEVSQALCTIVMAEQYIVLFYNSLIQCEMFSSIQNEYFKYRFKGTKTLELLVTEMGAVCKAVENANRPHITSQQCYDEGRGYDGKNRNTRIKNFFENKYPFDQKYFKILKKSNLKYDQEIAALPLCAGMGL